MLMKRKINLQLKKVNDIGDSYSRKEHLFLHVVSELCVNIRIYLEKNILFRIYTYLLAINVV